MAKEKLTLSLDPAIKERLQQHAKNKYTTISQLITDYILREDVETASINISSIEKTTGFREEYRNG